MMARNEIIGCTAIRCTPVAHDPTGRIVAMCVAIVVSFTAGFLAGLLLRVAL